ncbi:MAG: polysaccharide deacetylase family protein [Anaerolineae bacterium]|nr:polysaccharide deacetylase family protein [Anaerolineae bacterium]
MNPNPLLKKLGFSNTDRVAIIHADDVGMCQASVQAFAELDAFGLVSCGAVMVPCPWFPLAAAYAREHPQTDLGLHVTLTSEWPIYRWRAVSTLDPASGLIDEEGYFPSRTQPVQENGDPAAVQKEILAQYERALAFGIRVSHIDTHMGTVMHPKFLMPYISLGVTTKTPVMMFRWSEEDILAQGRDAELARTGARMILELEESGFPLLDAIEGLPLDKPVDRLEQAKAAFAALKPGITHFIIHPSIDTPELRAITPDWACRVGDYQTFLREDLRAYLQTIGVQVIGYADIQKVMRA